MAILHAVAHVTGTCASPNNALNAPDGVFTGDTGNTNWTAGWRLDDPGVALTGTQTVTIRARRDSAGGNDPSYTVNLYEGSTFIRELATGIIPGNPSTDTDVTFDATEVTGTADIRIELVTSAAGGNPNDRRAVQVDSFTFDAQLDAVIGDVNATLSNTTAAAEGTFTQAFFGDLATTLGDTGLTADGTFTLIVIGDLATTLGDTGLTASGYTPGPSYVEGYYVEGYYTSTGDEGTTTEGDLLATLESTSAAVGMTRFPAYWIKIAGSVTIQAGEESFHAILQVDASNNGGWWFDEVRATVNGGPNQLTNGLFETGDKTGWTANTEQDGVVVETGSEFEPPGVYTLQLEADPSVPQLQSSDSFPVEEGDEVYVEAWAYFYGGVNSKGKATGRTKNASGDTVRTVVVAEADPDPDVVTGELAASLDSTTAAVTGSVGVTGGADASLDSTTAALTGGVGVTGAATASLEDAGIDVAGAHGVVGVTNVSTDDTAAAVEASFGDTPAGDMAVTLEATQAQAAGDVGVRATVAGGLEGTTAAGQGSHGAAAAVAALLEGTTSEVSATQGVAGDMAAVLEGTEAALSGTVEQPGQSVLDAQLGDTQGAVQGWYGAAGAIQISVGDAAAGMAAYLGVTGVAAAVLDDTTADVIGEYEDSSRTVTIDAQLAATQAAASAQHYAPVTGAVEGVLAGVSASVSAVYTPAAEGAVQATLDDILVGVTGEHGVTGAVAGQLEGASAAFTFNPGSIGMPDNPGVVEASKTPGLRAVIVQVSAKDESVVPGLRPVNIQAGVRDVSSEVGVSTTGREPGVR